MPYLDINGKVLMTDGGLVRCDCCPEAYASYTCESEEISAELCGFDEYVGDGNFASIPPKKYRLQTDTRSFGGFTRWKCCQPNFFDPYEVQLSFKDVNNTDYVATIEYDATTCATSENLTSGIRDRTDYQYCDGVPTGSSSSVYNNICGGYSGNITNEVTSTTLKSSECSNIGYFNSSDPEECEGEIEFTLSGSGTVELSTEDTDQDAIDRETPVDGTQCSSLWETRSTGFSWTERTSEYTITAANLINGNDYEVTPEIRRRTAVIGSYGAWEDVTVASETFTATSDTEVFPAEALTHTQGYEYEITGVEIVQL